MSIEIKQSDLKPAGQVIAQAIELREAGHYDDSERMLLNHLKNKRDDGLAWAHLAHVQMLRNKETDAASALENSQASLPTDPVYLRNRARYMLRLRQYQQALQVARAAVRGNESDLESNAVFATCLASVGRRDDAMQILNRILSVRPSYAEARALRARLNFDLNSVLALTDAEDAVMGKPHMGFLWPMVAALRQKAGDLCGAINAMEQAVQFDSTNASWLSTLGELLRRQGQIERAQMVLEQAAKMSPDLVSAWVNLGAVYQNRHRIDDALIAYERALSLDSRQADVAHNMGLLAQQAGRMEVALQNFERALEVQPGNLQFLASKGVALLKLQRPAAEVIAIAQELINIAPEKHYGHALMGALNNHIGKFEAAAKWYVQALKKDPEAVGCYGPLGGVLRQLGELVKAERALERAVAAQPYDYVAYSNLLFCQSYNASYNPTNSIAAARGYNRALARRGFQPFAHGRSPRFSNTTRLNIGFVSGDLRNHPVGYFLESMLRFLSQRNVRLVAYSTISAQDELSQRIRANFSDWRMIGDLSDTRSAELIRQDDIHILLDLSGHTAQHRLSMFALKPAPVQASWLGYFATTGIDQMDWVIGDSYVAPEGAEAHFTERIWRLPECYLCFTPPAISPAVEDLPAINASHITFGCFNNLAKVNDAVIALWAKVLQAIPDSALFLKCAQLHDPAVIQRTYARFARHGIGSERLILEGPASRKELLEAYSRVDIALDPFPYPGGTTSLEALWMGVPVLTKKGDRFLSRIGETIANNAFLPNWIAVDDSDYIYKAQVFAADLASLRVLRAGMRARLATTALFDGQRFAMHFEAALRGMWNDWADKCENIQA